MRAFPEQSLPGRDSLRPSALAIVVSKTRRKKRQEKETTRASALLASAALAEVFVGADYYATREPVGKRMGAMWAAQTPLGQRLEEA
jgi:hypothetical protein